MEEKEFLLKELDAQIEKFEEESKKHKRLFRRLRYLIFAFTGLSTLLAGIGIGAEDVKAHLNIGVVVLTAAIGVVSSIEGMRKPGELWIMERNLYYALVDLKRAFEFNWVKNPNEVDINAYFDKLQVLLNSAGEKWSRNVGKEPHHGKR